MRGGIPCAIDFLGFYVCRVVVSATAAAKCPLTYHNTGLGQDQRFELDLDW